MEDGAEELMPVLSVEVTIAERKELERVALAGGIAHVRLESAPASKTPHVLEVSAPGAAAPLVLIAQIAGSASERGCPLKLTLPPPKSGPAPPRKETIGYVRRETIAYERGAPSAPPSPRPAERSSPPREEMRPPQRSSPDVRPPQGSAPSFPPSSQARPARRSEAELQETRDLEPGDEARVDSTAPVSVRGQASKVPASRRFVGRELAGGKLLIERCVGEGGAGTVFRARHRDLNIPVAVKVMHDDLQRDPNFARRFKDEALNASRLDHPNLTRVLDFGQEPDGLLYIAMEFLDGQSLRDLLSADKRIDLRRVVHLMIQVCSGLTHAHARKIVHRDIKPENLVLVRGLDDDGRETELVKICDFGIAHATGARAILAGTPEYMAPEQCKGEDPDAQSDLYACGIVMYELLTGQCPITGKNAQQIMMRHVTDDPDPPSRILRGLDVRVDRLVMKALAKGREVRHLDARELRSDLRALANDVAFHTSSSYIGDETPSSVGLRTISSVPSAASSPPVVPSPPPASAADWLERGPSYLSWTSNATSSAPPPPSEKNMAFLRQLAQTTDPARFAALAAPLARQIPIMVQQGQLSLLWRVRSTLDLVAAEKPPKGVTVTRATHAAKLLEAFHDPSLLTTIAERSLEAMEDRDGAARKLVVAAGTHGARALCSARARRGIFEARERFVAIMTELGSAANPALREHLERLEPRVAADQSIELADDLLKTIGPGVDEALGAVVARYVRLDSRVLAQSATVALPRVWGTRARSLLTWLVAHPEVDVAVAAISGLRSLGCIDEAMLLKLEPIVLGQDGTRMPVRIAATEALASASPTAIPLVRSLLATALSGAYGPGGEMEDFIVVICRTIMAVKGDPGLVAERWRSSHTSLRARLELILRGKERLA